MNNKCIILKRLWPLGIVIFFTFFSVFQVCASERLALKSLVSRKICHQHKPLHVFMAKSIKQKEMGLSYFKPEDFPKSTGLYFSYSASGKRKFWMPNTFFALDIIFIDSNMKVVGIERGILPSPKPNTPIRNIAVTATYIAKDVLEIRANDSWGRSLKAGSQLSWCSQVSAL